MNNQICSHYDKSYFEWQASIGEFGGWANLTKFQEYICEEDDVLDFGCGGGYMLKRIKCKKRVGVEINPDAVLKARENSVEVYTDIKRVPKEYVDIVISNNALEHTLHPLIELQNLFDILRPGGTIVVVVPCEAISYAYRKNDINHHLYSWSPMCLGNLLTEAGFSLIESRPYIHKWPPHYRRIAKLGGRSVFECACRIWGCCERSWFQVRAVGRKP